MYHSDAGAGPKQMQPALGARVPRTVVWIGLVSLLTDISSEMVASILPLYLFMVLRLSPLEYGYVDGLFNGAAAVVRVAFAHWADRTQRHKGVAFLGYALSALSRAGLFIAGLGGWASVAAVLLLDRIGKGIRTAPRDAMIAICCQPTGSTSTASTTSTTSTTGTTGPPAPAAGAAAASTGPAEPGAAALRPAAAPSLGAAFGVHRAMDAAGALAGPLVAAALLWAAPGRFDIVFAASCGFAVAGLVVLARWVRLPPAAQTAQTAQAAQTAEVAPAHGPGAPAHTPLRELWRPLARPSFVALCTALALLSTFTVSDGMLYAGLQARGAMAAGALPLLFTATAAVFMLTAIPIGRLADRVGPLRVFFAAHALLVLLYALVGWPGLPATPAVALGVLLLGLYYAGTDGVVMAWLARGLPAQVRTTGMALATSVIGLARMAASVLFGWCWTAWSHEQALWLFAAGMLASLGLVAAALYRWQAVWAPPRGAPRQ